MPTDLPAALLESFGTRFRIDRELGRGGMATVYLVHDNKHARDVALKVLHPELAASIGSDRFRREIAIAARLAHPNILPLFEAGEAGAFLFYLMPYVEGSSLRDRLARDGPLPVGEAAAIARDVARALAHAHAHNVLHRDIKPANILMQSGTALVADFGIARAITHAVGDTKLTDAGLLIGTPAYMAPEQIAGDEPDQRADVYALGCVLYEMLAGHAPFGGASPRVVLAQHSLEAVPRLGRFRGGLPGGLRAVIARSLRKDPDARYQTALEMADALDAVLPDLPQRRLSGTVPRRRATRRALGGATGIVLLAGAVLLAGTIRQHWNVAAVGTSTLDTTRYAVLPVEGLSDARRLGLDQDARDAFARWDGIAVADLAQVRDAMAGNGTTPLRLDGARRVARSLGAGRFVRTDIVRTTDGTLRIHEALYATADNQLLADSTVRLAGDASDADSALAQLAERLLLRRAARLRPGSDGGSVSLPARQAFLRGLERMEQWNLAGADSAFRAARAFDRGYVTADLWLALVRSWAGQPLIEWHAEAERALAEARALPPSARPLAVAVGFRAHGDLVTACARWKDLTVERPADFIAWYGLADCLQADSIVVRDPRARTGWRFRTSAQATMNAYQQAFRLLPSTLAGLQPGSFRGLRRRFATSSTALRAGYAASPGDARFAAYAEWHADTIAFEPAPLGMVMSLRPGATPSRESRTLALRHQRALFHDVARMWASADPTSSAALEAVAVSLELAGDPTALDTLLKARKLAPTRDARLQLAAAEVLMRLRLGLPGDTVQLRRARLLADSVLRDDAPVSRASLPPRLTLAALTGRAGMLERLARTRGAGADLQVLPSLDGIALPLLLLSALGGPAEPLHRLEHAAAAAIDAEVPREEAAGQRLQWLGRSAVLAYPAQSSTPLQQLVRLGDPLVDAVAAYARHDPVTARRLIATVAEARQTVDPAEQSLEGVYPEAWLLAQLDDAAGAAGSLDPALGAIAQIAPDAMSDAVATALLVRTMALRAVLAESLGDREGARRWARPVAILWSDADAFLRPTVQQMLDLMR